MILSVSENSSQADTILLMALSRYKKLARKWHPDKAKGSKVRAGRKMNDIAEAKEVLDKQLGCKGQGRGGRG